MDKNRIDNFTIQIWMAWAVMSTKMPSQLEMKLYEFDKKEECTEEEMNEFMELHRKFHQEATRHCYLARKQLNVDQMKFIVIYYRKKDAEGIWTGCCDKDSDRIYHRDILDGLRNWLKEEDEWVWPHGGGRIEIDREHKTIRAYDSSGTYGKFSIKQVTRILKRLMKEEGLADFQLIVE